MKTFAYAHCAALAAILLAVPGSAEKPQVRPYAAGSPSGGIPLWNPGEKFVAIAGGACSGTCPVYELYVFDDGRVMFLGKKYTGKTGVWKKQMDAGCVCRTVGHRRAHWRARRRNQARHLPQGPPDADGHAFGARRPEHAHAVAQPRLRGHADIARDIEKQFIDWTEDRALARIREE